MTIYVSYVGQGEIIVCTKREEKALLEETFGAGPVGGKRDVKEYMRTEHREGPGVGFLVDARKMW